MFIIMCICKCFNVTCLFMNKLVEINDFLFIKKKKEKKEEEINDFDRVSLAYCPNNSFSLRSESSY